MPPKKQLKNKRAAAKIRHEIAHVMLNGNAQIDSACMEQLSRCASAADRLYSELAILEQRFPLSTYIL